MAAVRTAEQGVMDEGGFWFGWVFGFVTRKDGGGGFSRWLTRTTRTTWLLVWAASVGSEWR